MRKLLFAPADPQVLKELRESLPAWQGEWNANVIPLAEAGRNELARADWDALVTDWENETGRRLLVEARHAFPEIARIGVASQAKRNLSHPAGLHQLVPSFSDFSELEIAVERCCRLRDLLRGERICRTIGELSELPSAPAVYLELMDKLNSADASVAEIALVIEGDVGISAKLLQVVNSVVFRTSREIITVKTAAGFLGLDVVKNLVLSVEAFQAFEGLPEIPGFSLTGLQAHCRLTATIAEGMGLSSEVRDAAMVAALLHDIGKLVFAYKVPDRFARLVARSHATKRPLYRIEEELWGITHAEAGAYLLGLWGLPTQVTEAIAYHHAPSALPVRPLDALGGVYVANGLAHEIEDGTEKLDWDEHYLKAWGGSDRLPEWRKMAREAAFSQQAPAAQDAQARAGQRLPTLVPR